MDPGEVWHECCCSQRHLLASHRLPFLPLNLSLHRWRCPSASHPLMPSLPQHGLSSPPLPFPWEVVPTEPLDCPCFTAMCWVHPEEDPRGGGVI